MSLTPNHDQTDRLARVHQVVEDCLNRRDAGELVADDQVLAAHPDLLPELASELRGAAAVRRARRQAEQRDTVAPPASPSPGALETDWLAAGSFPGYEIIREIHRGGQGVVYQAIQRGTKRRVAIKVIREGPFAGPRDRSRFEREVEILGRLNHPNIVAIHDSGTAAGSHYFVMDYISGQPLDVWMASEARAIDATLRLFARICEAVNAAHLRGVVHRDLKPGNIRIDANDKPHVLDFGLAKVATGGEPSAMTMTGQFLGSLPWAAPEQAEATPDQIDVRTDVYALGVILYQMLTGKFPYAVVGNMRDVLDRIVHAEPLRPSSVRGDLNDEVDTIVLKCLKKERERRYQSAGELARDIGRYLTGEPIEAKGDSFGYVVKKQIQKHRVAVGVGAAFALTITLGLILSLTLWQRAVVERDQARTLRAAAEQAREAEEAQRERAESNEARALHEAARAAEISGFLESLMMAADPFPMAVGAELPRHFGGQAKLTDVLDDAVVRLDAHPLRDPQADATIRFRIGISYLGIGRIDESRANLERALDTRRRLYGAEDPRTLECQIGLVWNLAILGDHDAGEQLGWQTVRGLEKALGRAHESTLAAMTALTLSLQLSGKPADAADLSREMLDIIRTSDPKPRFAAFVPQATLGAQLATMGQFDEARATLDEAITAGTAQSAGKHPFLSLAFIMRGHVYAVDGEFEQAEEAMRRGIQICRETVGDDSLTRWFFEAALSDVIAEQGRRADAARMDADLLEQSRARYGDRHAVTAGFISRLGMRYVELGQWERAESQFRAWSALREQLPLVENYQQAQCVYLFGLAQHNQNKVAEAESLYRQGWEIGERHPGRHVWRHEHLLVRLGQLLDQQGRHDEAAPLYDQIWQRLQAQPDVRLFADLAVTSRQMGRLEVAEACCRRWVDYVKGTPGVDRRSRVYAMNELANLLWERGQLAESAALYRGVLDRQRELLGSADPNLADVLDTLGFRLFQLGDYTGAEPLYREALAILRSTKGEDDPILARTINGLAVVLEAKGDHAAAEPLVREALALRRRTLPPEDPEIGHSLVDLGVVLLQQGKCAEAETALRECLAIREKSPPFWGRFDVMSALGEALAGQGKFEAAEPLVLQGYEGLKDDPQAWDVRKHQALERIIHLYEQWGKPDQSAGWRARRPAIEAAQPPSPAPAGGAKRAVSPGSQPPGRS